MTLPVVTEVGHGTGAGETVTLTYEDRFLRRKRLVTDQGTAFLLDLAHATSLNEGDTLQLSSGETVTVVARSEPLLEIRGADLVRLAWHIGNRHLPCQIEADRLVITRDHVIREMLERLGAEIVEIDAPFLPEGGAYGHGRTHSHAH